MFRYKNYVYEVFKEKSFSKAAANLYISQPSLSARIIKIEEEIGMPIFDRSTSPLRLTEFGEFYISAIEEVFKIERSVENRINDMNELRMGELSVGASGVYSAYVLPPIIAEFKRRFPEVNIRLTEGNTVELERMLAGNEIDLVLDNKHYDSVLYGRELYSGEQILLAVPRIFAECKAAEKYALSDSRIMMREYLCDDTLAVPLTLFKDLPFVMLTPNNDTRIRGDKICREAGFHPNIVLEVNQQSTAYMIASTNVGATFISDMLIRKITHSDNMRYFTLGSDAAKRDVYFYFKKHKYKTRAMLEFMKLIKETDTGK